MDALIQTKVLDDENEATLLTALTEILDNVDDENLSPFDTLPDSDLLSSQKGRENSPVSVSTFLHCSNSFLLPTSPDLVANMGLKLEGKYNA